MADNNKLKDYEKNMTTWCKSVLGKYRIMKKLNKDAYKKSIAKSLSETESIELSVGFLKPSFVAVYFLSILYEVPESAADPRGHSFKRSILFSNLCLSLLNIS